MQGEVQEKKVKKAVKHRKILRDNIQGITAPSLQRLMRRAGVKRIGSETYEALRSHCKLYLENVLYSLSVVLTHSRRKTFKVTDLETALDVNGIHLVAGLNKNTNGNQSFKGCEASRKKVASSKEAEEKHPEKEVKKRRSKPGKAAAREIAFQQKHSDCLSIRKLNFLRLVREILQEYTTEDLRFANGVVKLLQLTFEAHLVNICKMANMMATHAGRVTLEPSDVNLAVESSKMSVLN